MLISEKLAIILEIARVQRFKILPPTNLLKTQKSKMVLQWNKYYAHVEVSVSLLQNSNSSMSGAVMKRGSKSKNRIKM